MLNPPRQVAIVAAIVGILGAASNALAADIRVNWALNVSQPPLEATIGDTLTFDFTSGHNVEEFPGQPALESCDFSMATFIDSSGPVTITLSSVGTFYFGCSIGSHCTTGGMAVQITVSAPLPVPGVDPLVLVVALCFVAGASAWWYGPSERRGKAL